MQEYSREKAAKKCKGFEGGQEKVESNEKQKSMREREIKE